MHLFPRKVQARTDTRTRTCAAIRTRTRGVADPVSLCSVGVAVHAPETSLISSQFVSAIFSLIARKRERERSAPSVVICMRPRDRPVAKNETKLRRGMIKLFDSSNNARVVLATRLRGASLLKIDRRYSIVVNYSEDNIVPTMPRDVIADCMSSAALISPVDLSCPVIYRSNYPIGHRLILFKFLRNYFFRYLIYR